MSDVELRDALVDRGVTQAVHFTTNKGLVGTLASRALKSRARLPQEKYLEFIFEANAMLRKDHAWLDYVNLSISCINGQFFDICANKWHRGQDLFWVVLAFDPEVLTHDGVVFTTTNNMYSGVRRAPGVSGLAALFAHQVTQWAGQVVTRPPTLDSSFPTDQQAEALYPHEIDTAYLRTIYTPNEHTHDVACAQLAVFPHDQVEVVIDASLTRRT